MIEVYKTRNLIGVLTICLISVKMNKNEQVRNACACTTKQPENWKWARPIDISYRTDGFIGHGNTSVVYSNR